MKIYRILIPVLLVLAGVSVFMALQSARDANPAQPAEPTRFTLAGSSYSKAVSLSGELPLPLLETGLNGVYFTADSNGAVKFYELGAAGLKVYAGETTTAGLKVECSRQKIPVTMYSVKKDGESAGFGLFTNDGTVPVKIYDYAFFKITGLPAGYGRGKRLLLADFNKKDRFSNRKVYTEAFFYSPETEKIEKLVSDNSRTIDEKGAFRSDWVLLTDAFLAGLGDKPYYLSSRYYNLGAKGTVSDILPLTRGKPAPVFKGILGLWARGTAAGTAFLRPAAGGFQAVVGAGGKENAVREWKGDYFADYLQFDDYLLNKKSLVLSRLPDGGDTAVKTQIANPSFLIVSPDGRFAVIASAADAQGFQTMVFADLKTGASMKYFEPLLFSQNSPCFSWPGGGTLLHMRPARDDGTGLSYCVVRMADVF